MSTPPEDDAAGNERSPAQSQARAAKCEAPKRKRKPKPQGIKVIIWRELMKLHSFTSKGKKRRMPALEAILHRLWRKAIEDKNKRAYLLLLRYRDELEIEMARAEPEYIIENVDNEYTRALTEAMARDDKED